MSDPDFESNYNNQALAQIYPGLVGDWSIRWEAESPLILEAFDDIRSKLESATTLRVLETSLGTGLEAIMLHKERICELVGNELDPFFMEIAQTNLARESLVIPTTQHRWEGMNLHFQTKFHLLLCVGNSFNFLVSRDDQLAALKSFHELLAPEGKVIIDIRNWEPMVSLARELFSTGTTISEENYSFDGKPMYSGSTVMGFPIEIGEGWIRYQYTNSDNGEHAFFTMSTLGHEDMLELFETAGFQSIETYSDFEKGVITSSSYRQYVLGK
jgi:SAM-dependent methyltransferase